MSEHEKISYVELPAKNIEAAKQFFSEVFGWQFTDFGPDYTAFANAGLSGGFYQADLTCQTAQGGALIVLYSEDLEETLAKVEAVEEVVITKPIFHFPGGRRFQFLDPNGNEFAVWSDVGIEVA